ncbi:MAG: phosphatase family protein [Flaviaesturariibacter sp.]|nr:phosphatase family protein [Flaviaesturariibacter sp.]
MNRNRTAGKKQEAIFSTGRRLVRATRNALRAVGLLLAGTLAAEAQDLADAPPAPVRFCLDAPANPALQRFQRAPETARPVYRMNYWVSGTFSALATAGNVFAIPHILHAKPELTDAELAALNPQAVNGIDRWALRQDPSKREAFYKASDVMLPALMLAGGAVVLDGRVKKDWGKVLVMYYEMQAVAFTLYNFSFFGPAFQNKIRPVAYYDYFPMSLRRGGNQRNSFFSGHVAQSTAATFFMVKVYSDYHPEIGSKKYLLYGLASVPPLVQGYLRMKALAHFPSDILTGFALGAVCGIAVPALHRYHDRSVQAGVTYLPSTGSAGIRLSWTPGRKRESSGR